MYTSLIEEYKKNPTQFVDISLVEDDSVLSELGIEIPHKKDLPQAFLKLLPKDFIVEEIMKDGTVCTIDLPQSVFPQDASINSHHITLVKSNIGTLKAIQLLADALSISIDSIGYAGLKDEYAITSQRISIKGVSLDQLASLTSDFFFIKDPVLTTAVIKKGELKGNRFSILMRTRPDFKEKLLSSSFKSNLQSVVENGFYNFYYLQRFGMPRLTNHYCGYLIIKGEYKSAVYTTLCDSGKFEYGKSKETRAIIADNFGNWKKVHELLSISERPNTNEIKIAEYLIKHPIDFAGALRQVPDLVTLYVYSFSSWLFNKQLSFCIEKGSVPKTLPLLLSNQEKDIQTYRYLLEKSGVYPMRFDFVKKILPSLQLKPRFVATRSMSTMYAIEPIEEGVVLHFDLDKGEYATTFLSHLFNLVSYAPPVDIHFNEVDIRSVLGKAGNHLIAEKLIYSNKPVFADVQEHI